MAASRRGSAGCVPAQAGERRLGFMAARRHLWPHEELSGGVWAAACHRGKVVPWLIFFIQFVKRAEGSDFQNQGRHGRPTAGNRKRLTHLNPKPSSYYPAI